MDIVRLILRRMISCTTWDQWRSVSWAQEGEDLILSRIFEGQAEGFYIDIGAHHPKRFSNTYLFYRRGWRGMNIDAMPGSMRLFRKYRIGDINLEMGIGTTEGKQTYFIFNEPALNGFSENLSQQISAANPDYRIVDTQDLDICPLASVLDQNLPKDQVIDFMTIDVEGLDLDVLRSNNWERYRPGFILVEIRKQSFPDIMEGEVAAYMAGIDYEVYGKCVNTVFFRNRDLRVNC